MRINLTRGLNCDIGNPPANEIEPSPDPGEVAIFLADYPGFKASVKVSIGERVALGQTLCADRTRPQLLLTAPGSGTITAISRGAKRALHSITLRLEESRSVDFASYSSAEIGKLDAKTVREQLLRAGLWLALRSRPFNKVPSPDAQPRWIFVTATDTNPGAPNPALIINEEATAFIDGLSVLSALAPETLYLCHGADFSAAPHTPVPALKSVEFTGPHPAGLPGTHINCLVQPTLNDEAWHIGYPDVIAIGQLFRTGKIDPGRTISVCGDAVKHSRLIRTRIGAFLPRLFPDKADPDAKIISGSPLSGRIINDSNPFLGRFDRQVCAMRSSFLVAAGNGWRMSKTRRLPIVSGATNTTGHAGFVPLEIFEQVWPHPAPPVPLMRALLARDAETAEALGCLALADEDLALLGAVCPARIDYGQALRRTLALIDL